VEDIGDEELEASQDVIVADTHTCVFCRQSNPKGGGLDWGFRQVEGYYMHKACRDLCPEIYFDNDKEKWVGVEEEVKRSKRSRCFHCKRTGAVTGCVKKRCNRSYHLPCAVETGCRINESTEKDPFALFCPKHMQHGKHDEKRDPYKTATTVAEAKTHLQALRPPPPPEIIDVLSQDSVQYNEAGAGMGVGLGVGAGAGMGVGMGVGVGVGMGAGDGEEVISLSQEPSSRHSDCVFSPASGRKGRGDSLPHSITVHNHHQTSDIADRVLKQLQQIEPAKWKKMHRWSNTRRFNSIVMGFTKQRGKGADFAMPARGFLPHEELHGLYDDLRELVQRADPGFSFTTIQILENCPYNLHRDLHNKGPSKIFTLGDFEGGEFEYMGKKRDVHFERNEYSMFDFDGNKEHAASETTSGKRYSITYYHHPDCTEQLLGRACPAESHLIVDHVQKRLSETKHTGAQHEFMHARLNEKMRRLEAEKRGLEEEAQRGKAEARRKTVAARKLQEEAQRDEEIAARKLEEAKEKSEEAQGVEEKKVKVKEEKHKTSNLGIQLVNRLPAVKKATARRGSEERVSKEMEKGGAHGEEEHQAGQETDDGEWW
jgi:hypothetical protein